MELVLAALGIAIGASVLFNPWILPVLIAPLALAHRSLSTVALLRESEERFRTMFAAAPTAIMLFDRDGQDPLRQPLGGVAVRLFRAGDDRQAADDVPAPGRRR